MVEISYPLHIILVADIKYAIEVPPDSEIMVANVAIPYLSYNITAAYDNNQFQFSFSTGSAGFTTSNKTIHDGFFCLQQCFQMVIFY